MNARSRSAPDPGWGNPYGGYGPPFAGKVTTNTWGMLRLASATRRGIVLVAWENPCEAAPCCADCSCCGTGCSAGLFEVKTWGFYLGSKPVAKVLDITLIAFGYEFTSLVIVVIGIGAALGRILVTELDIFNSNQVTQLGKILL